MSIKIKKNQSGFSNIDVILGVVILSFVFPVLLSVVRDFNSKSINYELADKGTTYANTIMNYISSYRFDENFDTIGAPWTYPLGQDAGDYDDIDDFINMDWSIIPGFSNSGFTATTNIFYIDPEVDLLSAQSYQTNFKRIVVIINHEFLNNPITLTTILSAHEF